MYTGPWLALATALPATPTILLRPLINTRLTGSGTFPLFSGLLGCRLHCPLRFVDVNICDHRQGLFEPGDGCGPNRFIGLHPERPNGRKTTQTAQGGIRDPPAECQIFEFRQSSKIAQMVIGGAGYTSDSQKFQFGQVPQTPQPLFCEGAFKH